uniref:Uncharacterized protein n=1 Tax=Ditylenchus dipsaci TaxID=166011 RepID=A0A915DQV3_9BILA
MIVPTLGSLSNINDDETNQVLVTRILSSQTNLTKQSSYELLGESINSLVTPWPSSKNLNPFVAYTNASAQSLTLLLVGFSAAALPKATNNMFSMKEKVQRRQRIETNLRETDDQDERDDDSTENSTTLASLSSLWDNWGVKIGTFGFIIIIIWLCLLSLYCSCLRGNKRRVSPAPLASLYSRNERLEPPPPIVYY